jgi:glycosyltransferase involved in cell wall biosynthesis
MQGFRFDPRLKVAVVQKNKILSIPNPLSYHRIFQLVRNFNPDLVHDTSGNACKWTFGLWPLLAQRWPLVITEHDPQPHVGMEGFFPRLTRHIAWRSADHFIVHGTKCQQALLKVGIDKRKVSTNRHGSFAIYNQQRHANVDEDGHSVLFFGELRPNKGIYRLAAIARRVQALLPAAKFMVVGRRTQLPSRAEMAKVHQTVATLKASPNFEVHDRFVSDEEVEYFFRRAAVVILPYDEASQSGVIPLAFAFQKPVVAFAVGDLGESIVDTETGILVRHGDEEVFAQSIVALLQNAIRRRELGRRAYEWAQRELSWETIANKTRRIYHLVLSQSLNQYA